MIVPYNTIYPSIFKSESQTLPNENGNKKTNLTIGNRSNLKRIKSNETNNNLNR